MDSTLTQSVTQAATAENKALLKELMDITREDIAYDPLAVPGADPGRHYVWASKSSANPGSVRRLKAMHYQTEPATINKKGDNCKKLMGDDTPTADGGFADYTNNVIATDDGVLMSIDRDVLNKRRLAKHIRGLAQLTREEEKFEELAAQLGARTIKS